MSVQALVAPYTLSGMVRVPAMNTLSLSLSTAKAKGTPFQAWVPGKMASYRPPSDHVEMFALSARARDLDAQRYQLSVDRSEDKGEFLENETIGLGVYKKESK